MCSARSSGPSWYSSAQFMAIATFVDADRSTWDARAEELVAAGVPPALAARVASPGALFDALDVIEVADATSQPVKDVAALHFRLGSRLHLHWLRDRIADLSREDRWQEMARAALRDDLFSLHGELTADVLHGSPALRELRNLIQSTVPVSDEPASPEGSPAHARAAAWR